MRMVVGLDAPTSGQATVDGHPYRDLRFRSATLALSSKPRPSTQDAAPGTTSAGWWTPTASAPPGRRGARGGRPLIGDPRQLPELDAGGTLRALQHRTGAITLTTNRRQTEPWERQALGALRHGNPTHADRPPVSRAPAGRAAARPAPAALVDAVLVAVASRERRPGEGIRP